MSMKEKPQMGTKFGGKMGVFETQKPKNMWATIKRLMSYMKKSSLLIGLMFIVAIIGTLMQVFSPKVLGNATTVIFEGIRQGTGVDFARLGSILLLAAALYVGVFLTTFLQQWIMVIISQKTTYTLRNELKEKMNKVPISYFDKNAHGNLMSVAVNDIDNIATNLQQSLTELISSIILVVGFFGL